MRKCYLYILLVVLIQFCNPLFSQDKNQYTSKDLYTCYLNINSIYKKLEKRKDYLINNYKYSTEIHVVEDIFFILKPVPTMAYQSYATLSIYDKLKNKKDIESGKKLVFDSFTKMEAELMELKIIISLKSRDIGIYKDSIYLNDIQNVLQVLLMTMISLDQNPN